MQDHLQQTRVICQRRSQKALTEQATSKTKGNAAHEAMEAATQARERQEEARRLHEEKCQEATEAKTIYSEAIKDTLEKNEALEKRVTVTMRAESVASTKADFFKTLLDRQEETRRHLDELSAKLCQTRSALKEFAPRKKGQAHAPA